MADTSRERRQELTQEYLRTPREMGVYCVRNTRSGRVYVAASRDIRARINRHRAELCMGGERVPGLQADFDQLGEDAFSFETLDLLEPSDAPGWNPDEDLAVLEQLWLEKLEPFGERGYNQP